MSPQNIFRIMFTQKAKTTQEAHFTKNQRNPPQTFIYDETPAKCLFLSTTRLK